MRIFPVADLEPLRRVLEVGSELVLRHNAFEISLAGKCEQFLPGCLDVIAEQHALAPLGQDGAEALFAFDQRTVLQILAVTVQQVEGDEARPAPSEQEISSTLKKALAIEGPVLVGVPVDYRDNHRLMEMVHSEALN